MFAPPVAKTKAKTTSATVPTYAPKTARHIPGWPAASLAERVSVLQQTIGNQAVHRLLSREFGKIRLSAHAQKLQTKPAGSVKTADGEAQGVLDEVLRSPGQPLDVPIRAFMEPRFGHDFSNVRVHADTKAAESAEAMMASAYTVGQHVVFAAGKPPSETIAGRQLWAHELAHVVQQSRGGPAPELSTSTPHERDAEAAASAVVTGLSSVRVASHTGIGMARSWTDKPWSPSRWVEEVGIAIDLIVEKLGPGSHVRTLGDIQHGLATIGGEAAQALLGQIAEHLEQGELMGVASQSRLLNDVNRAAEQLISEATGKAWDPNQRLRPIESVQGDLHIIAGRERPYWLSESDPRLVAGRAGTYANRANQLLAQIAERHGALAELDRALSQRLNPNTRTTTEIPDFERPAQFARPETIPPELRTELAPSGPAAQTQSGTIERLASLLPAQTQSGTLEKPVPTTRAPTASSAMPVQTHPEAPVVESGWKFDLKAPFHRGAWKGTGAAAAKVGFFIAFNIIHGRAEAKRIEEQREKTGYVPPGATGDKLRDIGNFIGDPSGTTIPLHERFEISAWRRTMRDAANNKKIGELYRAPWETRDDTYIKRYGEGFGFPTSKILFVTYLKVPDSRMPSGKWIVVSTEMDDPPDLNMVINPGISDEEVRKYLELPRLLSRDGLA
jgi:hypothetical protein